MEDAYVASADSETTYFENSTEDKSGRRIKRKRLDCLDDHIDCTEMGLPHRISNNSTLVWLFDRPQMRSENMNKRHVMHPYRLPRCSKHFNDDRYFFKALGETSDHCDTCPRFTIRNSLNVNALSESFLVQKLWNRIAI